MSKKHKQLKVDYRKIWKEHYGALPKDHNGRNYHIHHIDGDPNNNDISNLQALSAAEHAKIHEQHFVAWASLGHKFWTKEGKEKRVLAGRRSGNINYKNKVGIFDPSIRKEIDELNSKSWRIVSPSRNIDITVLSLNKWCNENGISRSAMNCAYLNDRPHDDYYLLQVDKNEDLEKKYVPKIHKNSKTHTILGEDGATIEVTNLAKWCRDNQIDREGLKSASYRGSFYKGFKLWFAKPLLTGEQPYTKK
jgi:hypothetical protein